MDVDVPVLDAPAARGGVMAARPDEVTLPAHLVRLASSPWALWQWIGVRGAGFAADEVERLAAPASVAAADELLRLERVVDEGRTEILRTLRLQLDASENGHRAPLQRAIRSLEQFDATGGPQGGGALPIMPETAGLRTAVDDLSRARDRFAQAFDADIAAASVVLVQIASENRFREAVLWQNRAVVRTALDPLVRAGLSGRPRRSQQRQHEELVASYLQRYCVKNETIGFFGPVGWATLRPAGPVLVARPGRDLLAERNIYFEQWAIDALARAFGGDPRIGPWLVPRRAHNVHVEGTRLWPPAGPPRTIDADTARWLAACDGERSVAQIASAVALDFASHAAGSLHSASLRDPIVDSAVAVARDAYQALREQGLVVLELAVPMELRAERALSRLIGGVGDVALREQMMAAVRLMEQGRDNVARAVGNAQALDEAIGELERSFTRATGLEAQRHSEVSRARALVFEDCRRDLTVDLGPAFVEALAPPLSLLLTSARWLTFDTARRYALYFDEVYETQRAEAAAEGQPVGLVGFFDRVLPKILSSTTRIGLEALTEFQRRWADVLDLPAEGSHAGSRVSFTSDQLRARVEEAFAAPRPGWQMARYHSPDLMIAARSVEDVRRGDYQFVLGEMHVATNTLTWPLFLTQHPDGEALLRAADLDLPEPRLEPIVPRLIWPGQSARLMPGLLTGKDFRLSFSPDVPGVAMDRVLPLSALIVERADGRPPSDDESAARGHLVAKTRDGRLTFDLIATVAQALTWQIMARFKMLPPRAHSPRVTIDRLVAARESWSLLPAECPWLPRTPEAQQFLAIRRWAPSLGLPRCVFAKLPREPKPFYVDFASPVYVSIFARATRRSAETDPEKPMTLSEMLPEPGQSWLPDSAGARYSSELRMVAVDLSPGFGRPHAVADAGGVVALGAPPVDAPRRA